MTSDTLRLLANNKGAALVAAFANTASLLFGYDTGVAGSVVALQSFASEFKYSTNPAKKADVSSNIIALLNAGAFFGAVAPALLTRWVGRRHLMSIAAFLMIVGGVLQTAAQPPALSLIYGGRVVSGFGVGMVSNLTPVYVAETAPRELRGLLMSLFEMFSKQWRVPLSIQIILAAIVLAGSFVICESPRWLAKQNRWDETAKNLSYLRGGADSDSLEIKSELAEIRAQIEEEIQATPGRSLQELFQRRNFLRLVWGCGISFFSIWGGQTALLYYGPIVFGQIGFAGQNAALFASGMFTVIKVVVTVGFLVLGIQQFKRKNLFSFGAFIMAVTMFALGAVLKTHPPTLARATNNTPSGRGMMACIYIFVIGYSLSWGPLAWVYIGEIFPTRIRDYGMAIAVMVTWVCNFVVSKETPIIVLHIGWKTWMIFGTFNTAAFIFTLFLPETKGLSLEAMDILFKVVNESARHQDIEARIAGTQPTEEEAPVESPSCSKEA